MISLDGYEKSRLSAGVHLVDVVDIEENETKNGTKRVIIKMACAEDNQYGGTVGATTEASCFNTQGTVNQKGRINPTHFIMECLSSFMRDEEARNHILAGYETVSELVVATSKLLKERLEKDPAANRIKALVRTLRDDRDSSKVYTQVHLKGYTPIFAPASGNIVFNPAEHIEAPIVASTQAPPTSSPATGGAAFPPPGA